MVKHSLEAIEESCNLYTKMTDALLEDIIDFEDKYDELPIGITIEEIKYSLLRLGIITVDVNEKCKKIWDEKYHSNFCEDLNLKLIFIEEKTRYAKLDSLAKIRRHFIYKYTYENNVHFTEISPNITDREFE